MSKAMLLWNLGTDPEMRDLPSGGRVANFTVTTSEQWKNKEGGKEECTEWRRIVAFEMLAEICERYLFKDEQVYIEGRVQTRSWQRRR